MTADLFAGRIARMSVVSYRLSCPGMPWDGDWFHRHFKLLRARARGACDPDLPEWVDFADACRVLLDPLWQPAAEPRTPTE